METGNIKQIVIEAIESICEIDVVNIEDELDSFIMSSIEIMQVIGRIAEQLKVEINFSDFIEQNTIKDLVNLIEKEKGEVKRELYDEVAIEYDNTDNKTFGLTEIQTAYLIGRNEGFELGSTSTHIYLELEANIDIKRFNDSLNKVIKRHPMLRTIIFNDGTQKIIEDELKYEIEVIDATNLDEVLKQKTIEKERERMSHYVFNTTNWPLFEIKAIKTSYESYYLCIGFDMIIVDGTSFMIIGNEIQKYYYDSKLVLPQIQFTFKDYILCYNQMKNSEKYILSKNFWMNKLKTFPLIPLLPLKNQAKDIKKPTYKRYSVELNNECWTNIKRIAKNNNIRPTVLLCTAYAETLSKWSNQEKFAINLTAFNRYPFHKDVEKIVGDFTSVILLDVDMGSNKGFIEKAKKTQKTLMEALEHRHYDGVEFIREIAKHNNLSNAAVMPIVFTSMIFDNAENGWSKLGDMKMGISQTSQVYLDNQVLETNGHLTITWDYVSEMFEEHVIENMFKNYIDILMKLGNGEVENLIELSQDDLEILEKYNDTHKDIKIKTLHELVEVQAGKEPENIAVKLDDEKITYRELNEKSNQVARYLRNQGIGRNECVGVLTHRRCETIINILGVLKAGAAYVPIDPSYPEDRKDYIRKNSRCIELLDVNSYMYKNMRDLDRSNIESINEIDDMAYIIYTSGSTGRPKGVMINHGAAANTIIDINEKFNVNSDDKIIGLSSMGFDLSVYDIFGALSSGATLVLIKDQRDMKEVENVVQREGITIWNSVPIIMDMFIDSVDSTFSNNDLRLVLMSGDWIPLNLPNKIKNKFSNAKSISLGGATEASIWSIYYPIDEVKESWNSIPYGRPLANQKFYVLNYDMQICPIGVKGELYIGGKGLSDGYMNDEEKTRNAFIKHNDLGNLYKTGDFGIMNKDGYIEFLGRKDHQVKIRGHRIELGEIEKGILDYPKIKKALVLDYKENDGSKSICAYIERESDISIKELRAHLGKTLPGYMIPRHFVEVDKMPLNSNGKIDRKQLPSIEISEEISQNYVAPRNEIEKALVSAWENILFRDKIGINDNFFDLGGDSISLMKFIPIVKEKLGIEITLNDVINNDSISSLAELILNNKHVSDSNDLYMLKNQDKDNINEPFGLSDVQMAYVLGRNKNFEIGGISTHTYFEIETKLDIKKLNQGIQKVINKHPMLRAIFLEDGSQKILEWTPEYIVEVEDLTKLKEEEIEQHILEYRNKMSHHVFNIDTWPLFNFKAFKTSVDKHVLCVEFDLLIADGASIQTIGREIMEFYNENRLQESELDFSFRDYMLAHEELKESERYLRDKKYWIDKLEDFPMAPNLPKNIEPAQCTNPTFKRIAKEIPLDIWKKIKLVCNKNNLTNSALLFTAYSETLSKWSNQEKFAINLTVFNRYPFHKDVEKIVGDFTSVILLDVDMGSNKGFIEKAKKTQKTLMEALEHRHYDGVEFIREIAKHNNLSNAAVMPIVFTSMIFDNAENGWSKLGDMKMGISQTSQVYLDNQVLETNGHLTITWDYVSEMFEEHVIENMFKNYIDILMKLGNGEVENLIELSQDDLEILEKYNDTHKDIKIKTLHELVEVQAGKEPENIAVKLDDEKITYRELNEKSNQVARYLRNQGIGRNECVGVLTHRRCETIINILGVLKAGAAYVPIDPSYPEDRKDYIRKNSRCIELLDVNSYMYKNMRDLDRSNIESINEIDDMAYIIYTSGSTGRPKGVMINHGAAANTIIDINEKFNVNSDDKIIGLSSMGFDLSVYDIFGALSSGATLVLIKDQRDMKEVENVVQREGITIWNSVPIIMDMFIDSVDSTFSNNDLRLVLMSGDWIPLNLPNKIKNKFSNAKSISLGGATEASIWSIYYPIDEVKESWNSIPYGRPLANQKFYVLNYDMQICPIGVKGELYIGGKGLSDGYMNDEEKTRNAFIKHNDLGNLYKTGDFGIMNKDGYIEFLGRKDHQVKIRGHRIELGEIEKGILDYPKIKKALVLDYKENDGSKSICAYIERESDISIKELRAHLGKTLPGYMIPRHFVEVDKMPLNSNGKIDRKQLPSIEISEEISQNYVAPRNEIEKALVSGWESILCKNKIGINDNFFDLGGDSIKAIQIIAKLKKSNLKLEMQNIFIYQTVAELSEIAVYDVSKSYQGSIIGKVGFTPVQKWFIENNFENTDHWNQGYVLYKKDGFDSNVITDVLDKIVVHHDALRMIYDLENKIQVNRDINETAYEFRIFNLSDDDNIDSKINESIELLQSKISLTNGILIQVGLFKTKDGDHLSIIIHHLVVDGISWRTILEDFTTAYYQRLNNEDIILQDKTISYQEWSLKIDEYANSNNFKHEIDYWKSVEKIKLDDFKFKGYGEISKNKDSQIISSYLEEDITNKLLEEAHKAYNTEINDLLLSALGLAFNEWCGVKNIAITLHGHGREQIADNLDISRTVGWFTSMYPVVLEMSTPDNISNQIKTTKEYLRRIPNKGIGYGILKYIYKSVEEAIPEFTLKPMISFNYLGQFDNNVETKLFDVTPIAQKYCVSSECSRPYIFDVSVMLADKKLNVNISYDERKYLKSEIEDLVALYLKYIIEIVEHCVGKNETELTLSDMSNKEISEDDFENILELINE
ncbi:non-ribosomal peptide synthetase [Clostridium butyricum]|uniref:non-ribosomal peptide synthetase n=1 Tax=Clostridium butyricum TaxID=1492 RepID=UPI002AAFB35D|nr:non-ribosomal peptide synthetase [Clostridium butyricum]